MNTMRTPIIALVIVVLALIAWLVWAHEESVPPVAPTQTATSTATSAVVPTSQASTTSTINYPNEDVVASNIPGVWRSTDDPNYTIDVTSNGKWTDTYAGAGSTSGTSETGVYQLFASQNPDADFTGTVVPGVTYLKVSEGTSVLYYSVLEADATNLQLSYLDRGNTLSFVREQ